MIILSKLADYGVIVATHLAARSRAADDRRGGRRGDPAAARHRRQTPEGAGPCRHRHRARGAAGGYRLARGANAISVAEVVAAIDGDIGLTQCSVHVADCARTSYCPTRPHWAAINRAVEQALSAVSLDAMVTPAAFVPRRPAAPVHAAAN